MQRLEVSCAVRRVYKSLGAKGLIRDDIDDYCRTMVVGILMTMTVIDDLIFSINFIHTCRCSVLLLN
jgi:hypothetical protein